jgi:hypothetical protein
LVSGYGDDLSLTQIIHIRMTDSVSSIEKESVPVVASSAMLSRYQNAETNPSVTFGAPELYAPPASPTHSRAFAPTVVWACAPARCSLSSDDGLVADACAFW